MDTYTEEFRAEGGLMHVRLAGRYPRERLATRSNLFEPLLEACQKDHCRAAIIDARALQVDLDTLQIFRAGIDVSALFHEGLCVAFVAREDMIDPFFDDVVRNRGGRAGVFTNEESACSWINEILGGNQAGFQQSAASPLD